MPIIRIAAANLRFPTSPDASVRAACDATRRAAREGVDLLVFPEAFVPGYRGFGRTLPAPDPDFLERAWSTVAATAAEGNVGVVLGTERVIAGALLISALVIRRDGSIAGFQDKVQLDPSEDALYTPGTERRLFQAGPLTFGIAICHEVFRYPETVRWAARRGAQVVFHPHVSEAEGSDYRPTAFADPANSFHEKSLLCRAAENNCYLVSANCASEGSPTTSAIVKPDGTLLAYQPYDREGLLIADIELDEATRLLASRYKPPSP